MRTTIRIDDELYRRVRERAAASDQTIGAVIEDAIRRSFGVAAVDDDVPPLLTVSGQGVRPGVDISDGRDLRDHLDDGVSLDALR